MTLCFCASPRHVHCCLLCYPANSLLPACLLPCPHLLASIIRKARVWGEPLVPSWTGALCKSCPAPFLTDPACNSRKSAISPAFPSFGQLVHWKPPRPRATPGNPASAVLCQAKLKWADSALMENSQSGHYTKRFA